MNGHHAPHLRTALGACWVTAFAALLLGCERAKSPKQTQGTVSLFFIGYERRPGDPSQYARLALTNGSAHTFWFLELHHEDNLDTNNQGLFTVPMVVSEETATGWSAEKLDDSTIGGMGRDRHLDPGDSTTFLVPINSGSAPKRVGLYRGTKPAIWCDAVLKPETASEEGRH